MPILNEILTFHRLLKQTAAHWLNEIKQFSVLNLSFVKVDSITGSGRKNTFSASVETFKDQIHSTFYF